MRHRRLLPVPVSPKLLLLDLGGVIVDLGDPVRKMQLELDAADFWHIWRSAQCVREFELGKMGATEFFTRLAVAISYSGSADELRQRFALWELPIRKEIESLIPMLPAGLKVGLLSNTNEIHWASISSRTRLFEQFDFIYLSFETGHYKPDRCCFEHVLKDSRLRARDILFLDDVGQNVDAATECGMQAAVVSSVDGLRSALRSAGIAVEAG